MSIIQNNVPKTCVRSKAPKQKPKLLWQKRYGIQDTDTVKTTKQSSANQTLPSKKFKIAIFVDSEFFHGKDWETRKKPQTNPEFWIKKIERNMQRDIEVNAYLESQNWKILRFWSNDIKKNLDSCILEIQNAINERQK